MLTETLRSKIQSRDNVCAKKTLKGKAPDSHEKMLDLMMNTMTNMTEKLAAMDEHINGMASYIKVTPAKSTTPKSHSLEQTKRREMADAEEPLFASPTNTTAGIQEGGTTYSQVFPDTAAALKPLTTPARAKKRKSTLDLGITPLNYELMSGSQVTSTISTPTQAITDNVP